MKYAWYSRQIYLQDEHREALKAEFKKGYEQGYEQGRTDRANAIDV
jgi:flagellar biosynthesis/type III secretory pathway protein FliH